MQCIVNEEDYEQAIIALHQALIENGSNMHDAA